MTTDASSVANVVKFSNQRLLSRITCASIRENGILNITLFFSWISLNILQILIIIFYKSPYSCELCTKNFVTRPSLVKHLRVHRKERPHGCTVCNKRFATTYHLKLHLHTHTGAKPYECKCGRAFTQLGTLKAHQLKAHPQESAQCNKLDLNSIWGDLQKPIEKLTHMVLNLQ